MNISTRTLRPFAMQLTLLILTLLSASFVSAQTKNDFDLSRATISIDDILSGGPPRDGIPAINNPKFVPAAEVDYLRDDDRVIGILRGDTARAYPTQILVWHELVNDTINGEAIVVSYCPLCGTAMIFDRSINDVKRTFGVSGLLYQSDVLMYDRETESLWSQLAMQCVSGPDAGLELNWLPSEDMTWKAWKEKYPQGEVLSTDTGYERDYQKKAYASYFASQKTMFPVPHKRKELPNKDWVIGVVIDGRAKAYPVDELPTEKPLLDLLGDFPLNIRYDSGAKHAFVLDAAGEVIPSVVVFWFAWQAFYPETGLWRSGGK